MSENKFIVAKENRVGKMRLFSAIDSDGHTLDRFLQEFNSLEADDQIDEIEILINSPGGSTMMGFPIITAISSSEKSVTTVIDTIAASMAALVFLAGRKRKMYEHAQLMIHAARYSDGAKPDDLLNNTNQSIFNLIKGITKRAKATIEDWLSKDSWFNASQAIDNKFAHEIIKTNIHASMIDKFQSDVRVVVAQAGDVNNIKSKYETFQMDEILNELDLKAETTHKEIQAKIADIKNQLAIKSAELVNKEAKIAELQAKVDETVAKEKAEREKEIDSLVEVAFANRQINAEGKAVWKTILTNDFENGKKAISNLTKTDKVSDLISTDDSHENVTVVELDPIAKLMLDLQTKNK